MESQTNSQDQNTQQVGQTPLVQPVVSPEKPKINYLMICGVILFCFLIFGLGGYYLGKHTVTVSSPASENYSTTPVQSTSPAPTSSVSDSSTYTYNSFSFSYPSSWKFLSKKDDVNFPLKDRLIFDEEVVAVEKDGIYLIVNISKADQVLEAGGIFGSDKEYDEFVSTHDKVMIGESTFYLSKNYASISMLEEAHSGPALWGALSEYIPSKVTGSGNVFGAYEQIIKKNGYTYNIMVVGQKNEDTPVAIQSDIKKMLESIRW